MQLPRGLHRGVCGVLCWDPVQGGDVKRGVREERGGLRSVQRWEDVPEPGVCVQVRRRGVRGKRGRDVCDLPRRLRALLLERFVRQRGDAVYLFAGLQERLCLLRRADVHRSGEQREVREGWRVV